MIQQGVLYDAAGNKIENLESAGISFAMTMSEGFKALITEVQKLTRAIAVGLGLAIENIPDADFVIRGEFDIPDPPKGYDLPDYSIPNGGGEYQTVDGGFMGGLVTEQGIQRFASGGKVLNFVPRGIDTVPAMLATGEGVVNRTGMGVLGEDGLRSLNNGQSVGGTTVVNVHVQAGHITSEHDLKQVVTEHVLETIERGGRSFGRFSKLSKQAVA
jgi:hypothetical protein